MVYISSEALLVLDDRLRVREWEGEGGREVPSRLCKPRLLPAVPGEAWERV
jgi:hypothetical protein